MAKRKARKKLQPKKLSRMIEAAVDDACPGLPLELRGFEEDLDDIAADVGKLRKVVGELDQECIRRGWLPR